MYLNELSRSDLRAQKYITSRQKSLLSKLDLFTVADLLTYFPFRYEDRTQIETIRDSLTKNKPVTVVVTVTGHQSIFYNRKPHPKISVQDGESQAFLIGFHRPYLLQSLKIGVKYWLTAHFVYKFNEIQTSSFDFEEYVEGEDTENFGAILPIYQLTEKLYMKELRKMVRSTLDIYLPQIEDELPEYIVKQHNIIDKTSAIQNIHFPSSMPDMKRAKLRLAFEEFLAIQLAVTKKRAFFHSVRKPYRYEKRDLLKRYLTELGYEPTQAQRRALEETIADMVSECPMHRLIHGDVGSGKTTVAIGAMVFSAENGYQSALMVPTEVLAVQHFEKLTSLTEPLGFRTAILTGSLTAAERNETLEMIKTGAANFIIGTHALFSDDVEFRNLSLIIVDEQHKFGVEQRIALSQKTANPDVLVMTATPIPRTLTLTLYGDLDVSLIGELPKSRIPISTKWVPHNKYEVMLDFIAKEIERGRQAFFIYPLIEESMFLESKAAKEMFLNLQKYYKNLKIGMVHGKMKPSEKNDIMRQFHEGKLHILVSTSVIEVGIDIPNSTVVVIESAERFGLSQLHQLRGRVGRGTHQSYCFLVTASEVSEETSARMKIMTDTNDGFRIAEEDLRLRGPGEILGVRQSGLPELKIADYLRDEKLLDTARKDARIILEHDPELEKPANLSLKKGILEFLPGDYLRSG
ncbi:MAG: ATP-dependent DNA helicase RecG [Spirochaetes bacterium GWF1_49_6]|nr:MAG: ATP-dependent DNA helicase RecG [Spirochaetes bacterium GWF1_49_6]